MNHSTYLETSTSGQLNDIEKTVEKMKKEEDEQNKRNNNHHEINHKHIMDNDVFKRDDRKKKEGTESTSSSTPFYKTQKFKLCMAFFGFHVLVLLMFTGCVLITLRWNESLRVGDNDILLNAKDGQPIRINSYMETSPISQLSSSDISENSRLDSVMVVLPSKDNKDENNNIQRRYQVEATEIRYSTNTTLLWLTLNHLLTITPQSIILKDLENDKIINKWDLNQNEKLNFNTGTIENEFQSSEKQQGQEQGKFIAKSNPSNTLSLSSSNLSSSSSSSSSASSTSSSSNRKLYEGHNSYLGRHHSGHQAHHNTNHKHQHQHPPPVPYVSYYPYTYVYYHLTPVHNGKMRPKLGHRHHHGY